MQKLERQIRPCPLSSLGSVSGCMVLGFTESELELAAGQWLYLEGGVRYSLRGVENSSLLLTTLFAR